MLATSVESAYQCLARTAHPFDAVLLDLQLSNQRSEPVIERLRERGFDLPPIIIFSALPDEELRRAKRVTGAKTFVQKPASLRDIERALAKALA